MSLKVKFYIDSGANDNNKNETEWMDLDDIGLDEEDWKGLSDYEKTEQAEMYAESYMNMKIGYEEKE